jgi:ribonucleoside-diphosphate reductase alpha chain
MMSAVQPFLSGAISKTVNLPKEATVEEIETIYKEAWNLGLKAVAIYRDESKARQPLSFEKKKGLEEKVGMPARRKLPDKRHSITTTFDVAGHEGYFTVGLYDDGVPGEVFITMAKEGSTIGGLMDVIGILTSMSLQYGVPLEKIVDKLKNQNFEPSGVIHRGHEKLKGQKAKSLVDYVFRDVELTFLPNRNKENGEEKKEEPYLDSLSSNEKSAGSKKAEVVEEYGELCFCGERMIKKGNCLEVCPVCHMEIKRSCGQ